MKRYTNLKGFMILMTALLVTVLTISAAARTRISLEIEKVREGRARSIVVKPHRDLEVDVWTDRSSYYSGDEVRIYFNVTRDSYIYIFDTDTNGVTRQIFPNYYDQDNFVQGGHTYYIPDYGYSLEVTGPRGREYLRAVAVSDRLPFFREFRDYRRSEPFPVVPGGMDKFRRELESAAPPDELMKKGKNLEAYRDGAVTARESLRVVPRPRYREYAESYTSFYVHTRPHYRPHPRTEKIRFRSLPDDARLYIDGEYYGITSEKVRLSWGTHVVRMRKKGFEDWVHSIYVDDDTDHTMTAYMKKSPPPPPPPRPKNHGWFFKFDLFHKPDRREPVEKRIPKRPPRRPGSIEDRHERRRTIEDRRERPVERPMERHKKLRDNPQRNPDGKIIRR